MATILDNNYNKVGKASNAQEMTGLLSGAAQSGGSTTTGTGGYTPPKEPQAPGGGISESVQKPEQLIQDENTKWSDYNHGKDWGKNRGNEYAIQSTVDNTGNFDINQFKLDAQASGKYNQQQLNNIEDMWQKRKNAMYAAGRRGVSGDQLQALGGDYISQLKNQYNFAGNPTKKSGGGNVQPVTGSYTAGAVDSAANLSGSGLLNLGTGNVDLGGNTLSGGGQFQITGGNIPTGGLLPTAAQQEPDYNRGLDSHATTLDYLRNDNPGMGDLDRAYQPTLQFDGIKSGWKDANGRELDPRKTGKLVEAMMGMMSNDGKMANHILQRNPELQALIQNNPDWRERMNQHLGQVAMANLSGLNYHGGYKDYGKAMRLGEQKGLSNWWKATNSDWQDQLQAYIDAYVNQFNNNRANDIRGAAFQG